MCFGSSGAPDPSPRVAACLAVLQRAARMSVIVYAGVFATVSAGWSQWRAYGKKGSAWVSYDSVRKDDAARFVCKTPDRLDTACLCRKFITLQACNRCRYQVVMVIR